EQRSADVINAVQLRSLAFLSRAQRGCTTDDDLAASRGASPSGVAGGEQTELEEWLEEERSHLVKAAAQKPRDALGAGSTPPCRPTPTPPRCAARPTACTS